MFFLACVIVAGLYGAATVNRRILFVQALPAALALAAVVAAANIGLTHAVSSQPRLRHGNRASGQPSRSPYRDDHNYAAPTTPTHPSIPTMTTG